VQWGCCGGLCAVMAALMPAAAQSELMNGAKRPFSDTAYKMLAEFRAKKRVELGLDDRAPATSKAVQTDGIPGWRAHGEDGVRGR
jgi:hypothetical protein